MNLDDLLAKGALTEHQMKMNWHRFVTENPRKINIDISEGFILEPDFET